MRLTGFVTLLFLATMMSWSAAAAERPNILVIMADDMGFSDLGCYGGEIDTPHLDALAQQGLRYSDFRVEPMCVVTRAAFFAGMPYMQAGKHAMPRTVPLYTAMRDAGYSTHLLGKWHLGNQVPVGDHGFDRFYGFTGGQTNSFDPARMPAGFHDQDRPINSFPEGYYTTDAFTDRAIQSMRDAAADDRPFFTVVSYNAPHTPLHAPKPIVDKYVDRYQAGWETLREQRHARQIEMGLVDPAWRLSPRPAEVNRWSELNQESRQAEAVRMAGYAAMIDVIDTNVGRMLAFLNEQGLDEDTIVVFFSDNGGDYSNGSWRTLTTAKPWDPAAFCFTSNGWGMLKNTPFRSYKHSCYEGGLAAPLIIRWPEGITRQGGAIAGSRVHVTDLYPTLLHIAGGSYTPGGERDALPGRDFSDSFTAEVDSGRAEIYSAYEFSRSLVRGQYKAVSLHEGPWQLYDLGKDRTETTNLAEVEPDRLRSMSADWTRYAAGPGRIDAPWRRPTGAVQHGWGWHRMDPGIVSLTPDVAVKPVGRDLTLRVQFNQPITPNPGPGTIRLHRSDDPEHPVWSYDPNPGDWPAGTTTLTIDNLPELEADTGYFVTWGGGFIRVGDRPVHELNDGARWWRFTTE